MCHFGSCAGVWGDMSMMSRAARDQSDGRLSPPPVDPGEVVDAEVVNEEEDDRWLDLIRQQVRSVQGLKGLGFQGLRFFLSPIGGGR